VVHKQEEIERYREFIPAEDERKDAGRDQPRCGQQQRDRDQNARKGGQPSREGAKNRVGPDSFAPQRYRDVGARTQTLQPGAVHHSSVV
jgi:hypothetical protein